MSNYRLWMGTGNGVIISVPLNHPSSAADGDKTTPIKEALSAPAADKSEAGTSKESVK